MWNSKFSSDSCSLLFLWFLIDIRIFFSFNNFITFSSNQSSWFFTHKCFHLTGKLSWIIVCTNFEKIFQTWQLLPSYSRISIYTTACKCRWTWAIFCFGPLSKCNLFLLFSWTLFLRSFWFLLNSFYLILTCFIWTLWRICIPISIML